MVRLMLSNIRARKARFVFSVLAVALGVAFMAGTLVLTDTIGQAYDGIAVSAGEGTDAQVRSSRVVTDPDDHLRGGRGQDAADALDEAAFADCAHIAGGFAPRFRPTGRSQRPGSRG